MLIAYIVLGGIIGPYGLGYIQDAALLAEISKIGIMFLLFLLGLDMQPKALLATLKQSTHIALLSSLVFAATGYFVGWVFGFSHQQNLVIGAAMMFSSTIIGIKLLPTTVLHHRHAGELMVGLLLIQDLIAILVLMVLLSGDLGQINYSTLGGTLLALPFIIAFAFGFAKYGLLKLIRRFDRFHEYIFLMAIGWCLGLAELCHYLGLSREIGAFIAGISLANSPIAAFIVLNLKPLRDFFLVLFFFTLGAQFNFPLLPEVFFACLILTALVLTLKPLVFRYLLEHSSESKQLAWNIGFRLGQISEFSLLIAYVAADANWIDSQVSLLIQATAILTFAFSTYIVIFNFPTPIAVSDKLRRD